MTPEPISEAVRWSFIHSLRPGGTTVYSVLQTHVALDSNGTGRVGCENSAYVTVLLRLKGNTVSSGVERKPFVDSAEIPGTRAKWNLGPAALYEEAIRRGEGLVAADGPLVCRTGEHTGRSPKDKFLVREPDTEHEIAWGAVNRPMSSEHFDLLYSDIVASLKRTEMYVQDVFGGADPEYRLPVRIITEYAWHSLFARNLLIVDPAGPADTGLTPGFTIIDAPNFKADPARHGTRSEVVIALSFARRLVLIAGTSYAGEIKKSVFTGLNGLLPMAGGGAEALFCPSR